jgi:transcriptional regulator with XRE-family HTH domain
MPLPLPVLLSRARLHLRFNQQDLAKFMKSSLRSVQRWETGGSSPAHSQVHLVADAVRSLDPQIAAGLDAYAPRPAPPLVAVAAPLAPPPVTVPPTPAIPPHVLVDSVVCAAAEAMAVSPQAIRPAVLAAFTRASEAGLTFEAVLGVLAPTRTEEKGARGKGGTKGA